MNKVRNRGFIKSKNWADTVAGLKMFEYFVKLPMGSYLEFGFQPISPKYEKVGAAL